MEVTAPPNKEMGGIEFDGDKHITFITGSLDYGQGHASPLAQVLASRLGVPFESISLKQNDSDKLVFGAGTGGSRTAMMSGGAAVQAAELVIRKGKSSPPKAGSGGSGHRTATGNSSVGTDRSNLT
jgi:carbon-monoxide dehydrogenase large subunit